MNADPPNSGPLPDLLDCSPQEAVALFEELGGKPYRARQLLSWIYGKGETRLDRMTDLSAELRRRLGRRVRIGAGVVEDVARSDDGATAKYLFRLDDGARIEAVSMLDRGRRTVCVSSQVGCAMGCAFCATAAMGFIRDLTRGEVLLQPLTLLREEGRIHNVVFMGMGEPLLNLPNVLKAVEALTDKERFGLGTRRITISTCGIAPGIIALAQSPIPVRLALSLNSPFDDKRAQLMPVAKQYPLRDVMDACQEFTRRTGRRAMLEYVLFHEVNTDRAAALALASLAGELGGKINLIEYNPAPNAPFESPDRKETRDFREWIEAKGITVTIRFRRGREIAAGCGQLATQAE